MAEEVIQPPVKNDYSNLEQAMGIKLEAAKAQAETPTPPEAIAPPVVAPAETPTPPTKINIDDLSDEEINALIEKKTGGRVKSLEELNKPEPKTAEQLEKEKEERRSDALAWARENKKFTQADYDNAVIGKAKPDREIALQLFTADIQAEDKDITDADAEEMFKEVYHELDETSRNYKQGQKEIAKIANTYRKENFGFLETIESEYNEFADTQDQYKSYRTAVKEISTEAPKEFEFEIPYQYLDGPTENLKFTVPVDDKLLAKIINNASSENSFLAESFFTDGKIDKKQLLKKLNHNLKAEMFDLVIPELLKQNTKQVEERMEVVLGNKRSGAPELNKGHQNINTGQGKAIDYSSLDKAMKGIR